MDPLSAMIGAGGSIIGGLIGSSGAHAQNIANAQQAKANRDFQERMSSTAHQREVKDLRAAGLNPILSASKGASSPGGAQANMVNALEPMANSAKKAALVAAQYDNLTTATAKTDAEIALTMKNLEIQTDKQVSSALQANIDRIALDALLLAENKTKELAKFSGDAEASKKRHERRQKTRTQHRNKVITKPDYNPLFQRQGPKKQRRFSGG